MSFNSLFMADLQEEDLNAYATRLSEYTFASFEKLRGAGLLPGNIIAKLLKFKSEYFYKVLSTLEAVNKGKKIK